MPRIGFFEEVYIYSERQKVLKELIEVVAKRATELVTDSGATELATTGSATIQEGSMNDKETLVVSAVVLDTVVAPITINCPKCGKAGLKMAGLKIHQFSCNKKLIKETLPI